ncbi:hypothetical protein [Kocuria sp. NPDC057446]|uniref:hypothetical protein n=1 Tax=Kocuria sp. NPDC057446 TaxID=3346137 RepID=UPI0036CFAB21
MKPAVLAELRRRVGRRARITVLGDRWVLSSRTGVQQVHPDVEALVGALVAGRLVDRSDPLAGGGAGHGRTLEDLVRPGAPPADAAALVRAMLADAG